MDLEFRSRWEAYTQAKEIMLQRTHIPEAPWWVIEAVDKKRARLNCIAHLLTRVPYQDVPHQKPVLPARVHNPDYHRHPVPQEMYVPDHYANVAAEHAELGGGASRRSEGGRGDLASNSDALALRDRDVRVRKVVAFEQQRRPHRFGEGIGETVAEIEPRRMAAAFAEVAIGGAGDVGLLRRDCLYLNFCLDDQIVELAR